MTPFRMVDFLAALPKVADWHWEYRPDGTIHPDGTTHDPRHDIGSAVATVLGADIQPGEFFAGLEALGMAGDNRTLLCLAKMCPERPYSIVAGQGATMADWQALKYEILDILGLPHRENPRTV